MENTKTNQTHAICHRIEIEAAPAKVFDALATQAGLSAWWTTMVKTDGSSGSVAEFRFGDGKSGADMRIDELLPQKRVAWTCVDGPWKEMTFHFDIEPHERGAALRFTNDGWPEQNDFFRHCNSKWGFFLTASLKSYVEEGSGTPHPGEPKI